MDTIAAIRGFNRSYTRTLGLLEGHLPATDVSLPQGRLLDELATAGEQTAAQLGRTLHLDKAHVSRLVTALVRRGLVSSRPDPSHGKRRLLGLTAHGREVFGVLDSGTREQIEALIAALGPDARARLVAAMGQITALLESGETAPAVTLRELRTGDLGLVTSRQAVIYAEQFGWDHTYEALVARILADFVDRFDPARDDAWLAERGGELAGSVFLVRGEEPGVARLRLLYVEPVARGAGIGSLLVERCIARARELGYRRMTLWTNDVLVAARRIYEAAGFRLVAEEPHRSFGQDLIGQDWDLELTDPGA